MHHREVMITVLGSSMEVSESELKKGLETDNLKLPQRTFLKG